MHADGVNTQEVHAIVDYAKNRRSMRGVVKCCGAAYYAKTSDTDVMTKPCVFAAFMYLDNFEINPSIKCAGESDIASGTFGSNAFF